MKRHAARPPSGAHRLPPVSPSTESSAVLRDVPMHQEPRTLARPRPVPKMTATAVHATLPGEHVLPVEKALAAMHGIISASPKDETVLLSAAASRETGYQDGYAAGKRATEEAALEAASRTGYQEGYEKGLKEGSARGLETARLKALAEQEALAECLKRLEQLMAALPAALKARLEEAEDDMVALSHAAMCRMVGEALAPREAVAALVRHTIQHYLGENLVSVHVHPKDLEVLQGNETLAAWLAQRQGARQDVVRWVADERVTLGGCIVSTTEGSLDARLEVQWEALREWLSSGSADNDFVREAPHR